MTTRAKSEKVIEGYVKLKELYNNLVEELGELKKTHKELEEENKKKEKELGKLRKTRSPKQGLNKLKATVALK